MAAATGATRSWAGGSSKYRAVARRANYLGVDPSDIQFAIRGVPRDGGAERVGSPEGQQGSQVHPVCAKGHHHDGRRVRGALARLQMSDWDCWRSAGKNSTSGGVLAVGGTAVKPCRSMLRSVTTSTGEADYALNRGSGRALGVVSAMRALGRELEVRVRVDTSAAKAVAGRMGLRRTERIQVGFP